MFLHADSKDSDRTRQMSRLICVFAGCTSHLFSFVVLRLIVKPFFLKKLFLMILCGFVCLFVCVEA